MNRELVAKELLSIARELVAIEFPTQDAYDKYMKDHPDADKSKHKVVEQSESKLSPVYGAPKEYSHGKAKKVIEGDRMLMKQLEMNKKKNPDKSDEDHVKDLWNDYIRGSPALMRKYRGVAREGD